MVFTTHKSLREKLLHIKQSDVQIGFVPTMGALHEGHLSLMQMAISKNDYLVVSIFVNPTQFDNSTDLDKYPRTTAQDIDLIYQSIDQNKVFIYTPEVEDVYGNLPQSKSYQYDGLEMEMEGANRPGHFDGVGTILEFLFEVVQPNNAYFGEKDYQQLLIVKKLVEKLNLPINIVGCPIKRENSGLAMSSRNERLSSAARTTAAFIYQTLKKAANYFEDHDPIATTSYVEELFENHPDFTLEYFTIANAQTLQTATSKKENESYRAFIVAHIEGVRLIDNLSLS